MFKSLRGGVGGLSHLLSSSFSWTKTGVLMYYSIILQQWITWTSQSMWPELEAWLESVSSLFREGLLLGNAKLGTFLIFFILAIQTPLFYFFTLFPSLGPLCSCGYVDDFSVLAICFSGWSCSLILEVETCSVRDNVMA